MKSLLISWTICILALKVKQLEETVCYWTQFLHELTGKLPSWTTLYQRWNIEAIYPCSEKIKTPWFLWLCNLNMMRVRWMKPPCSKHWFRYKGALFKYNALYKFTRQYSPLNSLQLPGCNYTRRNLVLDFLSWKTEHAHRTNSWGSKLTFAIIKASSTVSSCYLHRYLKTKTNVVYSAGKFTCVFHCC